MRPRSNNAMKTSNTSVMTSAVRRSGFRGAAVLGVILAYGIGAWMVVLRHFQGGHQHGGQSLPVHWLVDSTLAVPGVIVAVALALRLAARKLAPGDGASALVRQAIATGAAAPAASLAFAASTPARAWRLGSSESDALPPPLRIARDTLLSLAIALPLAALGASLLLSERRSAAAWRVSRGRAILLAGSAALLAAASLGGSVRAADPGPGTPCPAGAPVKTFDVSAIDVDITSSGDAVGQNAPSDVALGASHPYRYYVPNDPTLEGAHYMRPGPGNRDAVSHGLFGVLAVEPPGSSYLNVTTGAPLNSGWEATIGPGMGKPAFPEFVQIYHEVGGEDFLISTKDGGKVPLVDPIPTPYRPDSRAIN